MQTTDDPTLDATAALSFPPLAPLSIRLPIESKDWTIWPAAGETWWDFVRGFPLELHHFAWDYVVVASDRQRVELKPHYLESTFDTFWVDTRGRVTCHALGGLFPYTLGRQPELLEGLRETLGALPARVEPSDPQAARTLAEIAEQLGAIAVALRAIPEVGLLSEIEEERKSMRATLRGRAAEAFWRAKRERSRRRRRSER